jgi:hypothetical protein
MKMLKVGTVVACAGLLALASCSSVKKSLDESVGGEEGEPSGEGEGECDADCEAAMRMSEGGAGTSDEANDGEDTIDEKAVWKPLAGTYQFSYGKITFVDKGQDLSGSYPNDGKLDCKWTGVKYGEYQCTWSDSKNGSGNAKMWFINTGELTASCGMGTTEGTCGSWWFTPGDGPEQKWVEDAGGGTAGGAQGNECTGNSDCPSGVKCRSGMCATSAGASCSSADDCGGHGAKCSAGKCSNAPDGKCQYASECPGGTCKASGKGYSRCSF